MSNGSVRVVQYGLGPIGQAVARTVLDKPDAALRLVGAIDVDPDKMGRDVATLLGDDCPKTGVSVSGNARDVLSSTEPDVVVHTTTSFLDEVGDQLMHCLEVGAHVVSSTEELAFPYERHPDQAVALNQAAREADAALVGTGVNPGYAMDTLPLTATGVCTSVDTVQVERVVNAAERRGPLQRKVGAGLSTDEFAERKAAGGFGHIGLRESLHMVAHGLGWTLDGVEERLDPVVADTAVETPHVTVVPGDVAGIHHVAVGTADGIECLWLDLKMHVAADASRDTVRVKGNPPIDLTVDGGIFGDTATVAMLVNTIPRLREVPVGFHTMLDLPLPRAVGTRPNTTPRAASR